MARKLTEAKRSAAMKKLRGWKLSAEGDALTRDFKFADFASALGFMVRSALTIETMDHHPEWSNVYDKVSVRLTTHSAGGVTESDVALAAAMDKIARA